MTPMLVELSWIAVMSLMLSSLNESWMTVTSVVVVVWVTVVSSSLIVTVVSRSSTLKMVVFSIVGSAKRSVRRCRVVRRRARARSCRR